MNRMKSLAFAFAGAAASAALVVSAAAPLAAQEAPSGDLVNAITALRAISTMRADFVQTSRAGQRVKGVLTLKRPGRIRFQYEKGVPVLVVSDGKALTFVDYEVRQVQRWPIRNSPLGALLDPSRDVMKFGRLIASDHPQVVSVEVRDTRHPEYGVITLDSQNNRTAVALSNQQYGVEVGDNAFRFKDPRPVTRR
jgi:outer membrane lipoprotein-sorting protein